MVNLKTQLILIFLLIGVLPVLIVGFISVSTSEVEIASHVEDHLDTTSHMRAKHIESILENYKDRIRSFSSDGKILECIHNYHTEEMDCNLNQHLKKNKLPVFEDFSEIFILNRDGIIIASSTNTNLELDKSEDQYFVNAQEQTYLKDIYYSDNVKEIIMTVSSPIFEDESHDREFAGVIVGRIELDELYSVLTDRQGWGLTGETYLVNRDGYMVSPSRFQSDDLTLLKEKVNTENSRECFEDMENYFSGNIEESDVLIEEENDVRTFEDYRGIPVIGTDSPIIEMQWCLLAEFDEEEAFGSVIATKFKIAFMTFLFAILVVIVALIYSDAISKPIRKLASSVDEITKGKFDTKLMKSDIFEINNLVSSLNRILASLKLAVLRTGSSKSDLGIGEIKKAKEEAEIRYKTLVESSPDCIKIFDSNEKIIFMNEGGLKEHGFNSIGDALKLNWMDSIVKSNRHNAKKAYEDALKGKTTTLEVEHTHEGSNRDFCLMTFLPIKGIGDYVKNVLVISRDISQLKISEDLLSKEKEFSHLVQDAIPYGMDVVDENLKILHMNKTFLKIFGNKSVGKKCYQVYCDDKKQCGDCPMKKSIKIGETRSLISKGIAGGKTYKITHTGFKLQNGKKAVLEFFEKIDDGKKLVKKTISKKVKSVKRATKTRKKAVKKSRKRTSKRK